MLICVLTAGLVACGFSYFTLFLEAKLKKGEKKMIIETKKLTRAAVMIALGTTLSFFKVYNLGNGGSVTMGSMVPVILISFVFNTKEALLTSFVYSLLQMLVQGISTPPVENFLYYFLVIILDYVLAFSVLGLGGTLFGWVKNKSLRMISGTVVVVFLRFICHFMSGVFIWKTYAPEGQSVFLYSLLYNGSYMSGELIITVAVISLLSATNYIKKLI